MAEIGEITVTVDLSEHVVDLIAIRELSDPEYKIDQTTSQDRLAQIHHLVLGVLAKAETVEAEGAA